MIKIGPLSTHEIKQATSLLQLQAEPGQESGETPQTDLALNSLSFWQHWLPPQTHLAPSIYVAREDGRLLGIIAVQHRSKSKTCWQVDKLVVHPEHRGRGIAQELLRYVFAQFGSQGVMHFLAEVPAVNEAALSLFANCGFCRSSRITFYKHNPEFRQESSLAAPEGFKTALPHLKSALYQLHCEVLPPALRQVLLLAPEDFQVREMTPFTSVEKSKQKLMRKRVWYWVLEDPERMVLTAAVKVTAEPLSGYRLEFAVHPGWKDREEELIRYALYRLKNDAPKAAIWARVYDFQGDNHELMKRAGFERTGESFLLLREHWQRARKPQRKTIQLSNPVINFPLAADRNLREDSR